MPGSASRWQSSAVSGSFAAMATTSSLSALEQGFRSLEPPMLTRRRPSLRLGPTIEPINHLDWANERAHTACTPAH